MSTPETTDASFTAPNSRKRGYEGNDDDRPAKKQKKLVNWEQQETHLRERAKTLKQSLATLKDFLTAFSLVDDRTSRMLRVLSKICDDVQRTDRPRVAHEFNVLKFPIPLLEIDVLSRLIPRADDQAYYKFSIEDTNSALEKVATLYEELLESDMYPPSASTYAEPTTWPKWQRKPTAILNLRPSVNQGLPLSILHPVFARFRATVDEPLPTTTDASISLHAAFNLCIEMAESYDDDAARRTAFEASIKPLFAGYDLRHEVTVESLKWERRSSRINFLISHKDRNVLAGECKVECGEGDAYMRLSRVYQTWVNQLKDEEAPALPHGAPMVLVCVMGPLLIVAGGFSDGKSVIVEPLTAPCLMLPDYHHQRQEQLARVLFATKEAVESLAQLQYMTKVTFEPALPRVYPTFTGFEGQVIDLTFKSRLAIRTKDPNRNLLFLASCATSSQQVLVKLIADDQYGVEAHLKLAKAELAPALYGFATVKGAHTAYIMEYLPPADGWVTLHEYAKNYEDALSRLQTPLAHLFETMEREKIVHGDLRPNNIMIKDKGAPQIRVMDFDWAGFSGTVKYPLRRNEDIPWPAQPGEVIITGHDQNLLMACLKQIVPR